MKVRKNWFSYLLWFLFSCSLALLFYYSFTTRLKAFGIDDIKVNGLIVAGCAVVLILVVCLFNWLFTRFYKNYNEKAGKILTIVFFMLNVMLFFIIRVFYIPTIDEIAMKDTPYFQNAMILLDGTLKISWSSLEDIYTAFLSVFCRFLGNRWIVVVALQIVLQFFALILNYKALQRISGSFVAIVSGIGFSLLPLFTYNIIEVNLYSFNFFIFSLLLWILSYYKEILEKNRVIRTILIPILVGYAFYLNNIFVATILLPVIICINTYLKLSKKIFRVFAIAFLEIVGFLLPVCILAVQKKTDVFAYMIHYIDGRFRLTLPLDFLLVFPRQIMEQYIQNPYLIIVFVLCFSYVVMFFKTSCDEGYIYISIVLITVLFLFFFKENELGNYFLVITECLLAVAGAGIRNLIWTDKGSRKIKVNDKDTNKKEQTTEEKVKDKDINKKEQTTEEVVKEEAKEEIKSEADKVINVVPTKKIEYIENPLPLPKKHVKRQMEYGFIPKENQMNFDIELTEKNSDYDI